LRSTRRRAVKLADLGCARVRGSRRGRARIDPLFTMSDNKAPRRSTDHARSQKTCSTDESHAMPGWWSQTGSNRRPPACKAGALPTELWPHQRTEDGRQRTEAIIRRPSSVICRLILVGLGRFELPTSRLSSARSNQLSYKPGPENRGRTTEDRNVLSVVCRLFSVL
jgi:hypothetical protein